MKRYSETRQPRKPAALQFPEQTGAGRLTVMRSAHTTATAIYPQSRAFVVTKDGARLVAGRDASASAVSALHHHAEAHARQQNESQREAWRTRRAA